jgi:hypothetical protein
LTLTTKRWLAWSERRGGGFPRTAVVWNGTCSAGEPHAQPQSRMLSRRAACSAAVAHFPNPRGRVGPSRSLEGGALSGNSSYISYIWIMNIFEILRGRGGSNRSLEGGALSGN